MGIRKGFQMKLYYLLTGGVLAPRTLTGWPAAGMTLASTVANVDLDKSREPLPLNRRIDAGCDANTPGVRKDSGTIEMDLRADDTFLAKLEAAASARTMFCMGFLDGLAATPGARGTVGDWVIVGYTQSQPARGKVAVKITFKAGDSDYPPEEYTVPTP